MNINVFIEHGKQAKQCQQVTSKRLAKGFSVLLFLLLNTMTLVNGQESVHVIKSVYLFNFFNFITWQNEEKISTFQLGIVGRDDDLYQELTRASKKLKRKGKNIQVVKISSNDLSSAAKMHLVFITRSAKNKLTEIASIARKTNTLIVTEEHSAKSSLMINLITSKAGKVIFEINKSNIVYEGLLMDKKILLSGGTEMDVAQLLRSTEEAMLIAKQQLQNNQNQLANLQQKTQLQTNLLSQKNSQLATVAQELSAQRKKISQEQTQLKIMKQQLSANQSKLLQTQQNLIAVDADFNRQKQQITLKEQEVYKLSSKIAATQNHLTELTDAGQALQLELSLKRKSITALSGTVSKQQDLLWLTAVVLAIFALLLVIIFRQARLRKNTNQTLALNITKLESTQLQLQQSKVQAEQANLHKSEFLANMSHELRTPLNAVLGFSELLQERIHQPEEKRYVHSINTAGNSLLSLINDILDLSKIEAGKLELYLAPLSLAKLCDELHILFADKCQANGISFDTKLSDTLDKKVLLDENRLKQIILNLVSNAIKFTEQGGVSIELNTDINDKKNSSSFALSIAVIDTGKGISKDAQNRIFNAFEQVKDNTDDNFSGTGLGLAISTRLAKLMGGEINLQSTPEEGSCFTLYLPAVERASMQEEETELAEFKPGKIDFSEAKVLIADDISYNLELLEAFLSEWPALKVVRANNGLELINLAAEIIPDIILTDLRMPVMDGYEASKKLKQNAKTQHIPIVAITASALEQDEIRIRKICEDYLRKPVSKKDLTTTMMKYLPYQEVGSAEVVEEILPSNHHLSAQDFNGIDQVLLAQLLQATLLGDIEQAKSVCQQFSLQSPVLCKSLLQKLDDFAYDEITQVLAAITSSESKK